MQYNCHVEKYHYGDIGGIEKEQFREYKDKEKYKNYVDHDKTKMNIYHRYHDQKWIQTIKAAQEVHLQTVGKAIRKDAVVFDSIVQSVPASWDYDLANQYFLENEEFLKDFLIRKGVDPNSFLSSVTHWDEKNPHQTFTFMPIKNGKFDNSKIMNRDFLRDLQKEGFEFYQKFSDRHPNLEKLDAYLEDSGKKHLSEVEYKLSKTTKLLEQVQNEIENYSKTVNLIIDRTAAAKQNLEKLDQEFPFDELMELNEKLTKEPKDTGKTFKNSGKDAYQWIFSLDWLESLKRAFTNIKNWFKERNYIIETVRIKPEEKEYLDKTPKRINDLIAEAEKLMKENNSAKVEKNKNKEYEH